MKALLGVIFISLMGLILSFFLNREPKWADQDCKDFNQTYMRIWNKEGFSAEDKLKYLSDKYAKDCLN
jgi:hypothetical protein